jgi:pyroglutamyl-peptidase
MHRRRSRERRDHKPRGVSAAPAPTPSVSKRRPRPDVVVPAELKIAPARKKEEGGHPGRGHRRSEPGLTPSSNVILVTGFEGFGGESINPSWEICTRLPREIAGARVETCRVPCEFRRSIEVVAEAIERHRPSIVVSLGQAGGRDRIGIERVGINVDDARIPDNAGARPIGEAIASNGPPAYFATLPVKAMVRAVRAAGIAVELSNSAGTYVCNHVMYGVLHFLAASGTNARAGFIHVPYLESQVLDKRGVASMSLDSMVKGIAAAIEAAVRNTADIAVAEGALD